MYQLVRGDSLNWYSQWPTPTVIISDGPYGVCGYPGDRKTADELPDFYEPHVRAWADKAEPNTVLWFWNTELGWATVHPVLKRHGWVYHGCNIWNKGLKHIAGNCNGKTMRQFPVVTEVCVLYVRQPLFKHIGEQTVQEWLRSEWLRTGLPLNRANAACGVRNAATRKYLTADHLFYFPPVEVFRRLIEYANAHGDPSGHPYFTIPGDLDPNTRGWDRIWYRFNFPYGVSNVWDEPALRSSERIKLGNKALHLNQKPLVLMERIIRACSDEGDSIWEPFGGLCTASLAALGLKRRPHAAEINDEFFNLAVKRLSGCYG